VSFMEVAIWFAVTAFLVLRIAMLVAFVALPVTIVRKVRGHSTA
jgi:hypothetical protein